MLTGCGICRPPCTGSWPTEPDTMAPHEVRHSRRRPARRVRGAVVVRDQHPGARARRAGEVDHPPGRGRHRRSSAPTVVREQAGALSDVESRAWRPSCTRGPASCNELNEQLRQAHARERQVAVTLQEAMLHRPDLDRHRDIAVRYLPAAGSLNVCGDWYDVVDLPPDRSPSRSATSSATACRPPPSWACSAAPCARPSGPFSARPGPGRPGPVRPLRGGRAGHRRFQANASKFAAKLEQCVNAELKPLRLDRARFLTDIATDLQMAGPHGMDRVEFWVQTNPGTRPGPLMRVASGGELARFLLALKVVLAHRGSAPTLVFDEIDTGAGGAVADAIGVRLARLAERAQVIAVTHAPQVAARADRHYLISKRAVEKGTRVATRVVEVAAEKRREEIARMLAGAEITAEARRPPSA